MNITEKQSICHKRKNNLLKRQTESELLFASILDRLGVRYMPQKGFIAGNNFCIVDFYLPDFKTCVEIDGGYHNEPNQIKRDSNRDYYLNKQRKFGVIHIENEALNSMEDSFILDALNKSKSERLVYKY